jgi:GPH family glycoside/pentoside/hexuronide:cation symporter
LSGSIAAIKSDAEQLLTLGPKADGAGARIAENVERLAEISEKLRSHLRERFENSPDHAEHIAGLQERADVIRSKAEELRERRANLLAAPQDLVHEAKTLQQRMTLLRKQTPTTLFRLRLFEISVPIVLSVVSIFLTLRYPLTEARCYEIKEALQARHAKQASTSQY